MALRPAGKSISTITVNESVRRLSPKRCPAVAATISNVLRLESVIPAGADSVQLEGRRADELEPRLTNFAGGEALEPCDDSSLGGRGGGHREERQR